MISYNQFTYYVHSVDVAWSEYKLAHDNYFDNLTLKPKIRLYLLKKFYYPRHTSVQFQNEQLIEHKKYIF